MFYEMLIIILCSVVILLLIYIRNESQVNKKNLDMIIIRLRNKYKIMLLNNRIPNDICDENEKLGDNREDDSKTVGNNCEPWISRECIFVLDHILAYNSIGLEWSSGSSTIWLSYRLKSLISIENMEYWSNVVKTVLENRKLDSITKLYFIDKDELKKCKSETKYMSVSDDNPRCFKTYVSTDIIPNVEYDFISVDGRARTGCLLRAIKLLKSENGILLMDNAERDRYQWSFSKIPPNWRKYDFWYDRGLVRMWISHK